MYAFWYIRAFDAYSLCRLQNSVIFFFELYSTYTQFVLHFSAPCQTAAIVMHSQNQQVVSACVYASFV